MLPGQYSQMSLDRESVIANHFHPKKTAGQRVVRKIEPGFKFSDSRSSDISPHTPALPTAQTAHHTAQPSATQHNLQPHSTKARPAGRAPEN